MIYRQARNDGKHCEFILNGSYLDYTWKCIVGGSWGMAAIGKVIQDTFISIVAFDIKWMMRWPHAGQRTVQFGDNGDQFISYEQYTVTYTCFNMFGFINNYLQLFGGCLITTTLHWLCCERSDKAGSSHKTFVKNEHFGDLKMKILLAFDGDDLHRIPWPSNPGIGHP